MGSLTTSCRMGSPVALRGALPVLGASEHSWWKGQEAWLGQRVEDGLRCVGPERGPDGGSSSWEEGIGPQRRWEEPLRPCLHSQAFARVRTSPNGGGQEGRAPAALQELLMRKGDA